MARPLFHGQPHVPCIWLGGAIIERGPGLAAVPWVAALVTLGGLAVALWSVQRERARGQA